MNRKTERSRILPVVWLALGLAAWSCATDADMGREPAETDPNRGTDWILSELSADEGVSFRIPTFEVDAMSEEQTCYFLQVPDVNDGKDFWVDEVRLAMNPGSHHMNIFRVRTIKELRPEDGEPMKIGPYDATVIRGHGEYQTHPCWNSANWSDWPLVANTQHANPKNPYTSWKLPEKVAMRFTPGEMLMIQSHYVNTTTQPTPSGLGRVGINLYRNHEEGLMELGTLFATQQNLRICQSNRTPMFSGTCRFPGPVTITAANGHFHSRGKQFSMFTWDGQDLEHPAESAHFYTSNDWNEPPMTTGIERSVPKGAGIWWDCQYQWQPPIFGCDTVNAKDPENADDCCYVFGGNTDVGEHCNVFLYYYPRVKDTDVFCN
ncbi:MAG TPA: hypothetical protein VJR89_33995 [Polyangiales bacterium]|nr:hypothetical protein [Polyangiales bacterium]